MFQICDYQGKIISLSAQWAGGNHDSFCWTNSGAAEVIRRLATSRRNDSFYILGMLIITVNHNKTNVNKCLGDSGFGLERCVMVPFLQPITEPQRLFNEQHKRARSLVERCIGAMKNSFRATLADRTMHYSPEKAGLIVNVCAMLSNIRLEERVLNTGQGTTEVRAVPLEETGMEAGFHDGEAVRNQIVENYFA